MYSLLPKSCEIFNGYHHVLAGRSRGKYICVCLQCGKFLAVCSSLQQVAVVEKAHTCRRAQAERVPHLGHRETH